MKPILILGLGNPLQGDDGVGCRVAEALAKQTLSEDIEVMDGGTPGVGLVNLFEGRRRVVIVDAVEMGESPGQVRQFESQDVVFAGSSARLSLHRSGVADALALARALGIALPEIIVLGVQPAYVGWSTSLSTAVRAAVPQVVEMAWHVACDWDERSALKSSDVAEQTS